MTTIDNLSAFYLTMYNNKTASLNLLVECAVPKDVFLSTYRNFIKEQLLTPIENLMIEEKIKLWEECKETGITDKYKLVDAAKILHTLKFINENS